MSELPIKSGGEEENMNVQANVDDWMKIVFTEEERINAPERSLRCAEEALELTQALGVDRETIHRLVDYVYGRPVGEAPQEIAGTMVTLYSVATALGVDADSLFLKEMARVYHPDVIARCRRRQHEKREALASTIPPGDDVNRP